MADDRLQKSIATEEAAVGSTGVAAAENPISREAKQPEFSGDEETLIIRMYNLVGERWSLIAGRIPGRSAEEIEKYWNSRHSTSQ
ncbi:UNVERIFIED_CONTAM: Transcription factor CPC [Sesamum radiatum]|uniref:Transcription factor CPC n=1 Tax=Sesamum radiatum TaxID=300843 RepID=A0AAW2T639_SESRA